MPVTIIICQAAASSVLALGYGVLGSVQNAWFIFAIIQTNMTLVLYGIMFAAVVKLRYSKSATVRPYRIPGKMFGVWVVASIGLLVCLAGIAVSLFPTEEAGSMSTIVYVSVVVLGTLVFLAMPFVFWIFKKPSWKTEDEGDPASTEGDPEALATTG